MQESEETSNKTSNLLLFRFIDLHIVTVQFRLSVYCPSKTNFLFFIFSDPSRNIKLKLIRKTRAAGAWIYSEIIKF